MLSAAETLTLGELALFKGLPVKSLTWLAERLRGRIVAAGNNLITAEMPGEVVYIIVHGTVKIHIEQTDGGDVVLAILGRGDPVGEMSLVDSAGRSASALTLEESSLLWLDAPAFQQALHAIPELALNLVRILSARVRLANEHIQALATLDVHGRVARQLLAFAEKYGETAANGDVRIPIRLTQGDLADLVGASRKRVNQAIVAFKKEGVISVGAEYRITVHQRAALARWCR